MKFNKWTMGLAAVGVVSLASAARADEKVSVVNTALSNTTLSGYVDTAMQWNPGSQNGGYTPGSRGAYADGVGKQDGFNLNLIDLALDKPLTEDSWAAGYHVELNFGQDAINGYNSSFNSGVYGGYFNSNYGIRQAYVALRTPVGNSAIDWKVGVWDTIIGYESNSDPLNPNYTRSYGYTMEPTTETGILGTYKINDMFSVSAGVANLAGTSANNVTGRAAMESQKAYMGSFAFTAPDNWGWAKGTTVNAGIIDGVDSKGAGLGGTFAGSTSFYAGATVPTPLTALKVGAAFDYLDMHNAHHGGGNSDGSQWVAGVYASFQVNDKLSFNGRAEHEAINNSGTTLDEFTATASYKLWANVLSRVELRWDHTEHYTGFDNSAYNLSGTSIHDNAYLLALNLIYQF